MSDMNRKRKFILRRKQIVKRLPPLTEVARGSLLKRHRRCGKPNCHCTKSDGHRTWYLTVSFAQGHNEQVTVPDELVPYVRQWIKNYEHWWNGIEEISAINRKLLRKRWIEGAERKRRKR
jgi:hypothetical protein